MSKNKQLKDLFIEDLGQVTGGKPYTTLALGEEGGSTVAGFEEATTLALGEEGGSTYLGGEEATTLALGEEGDNPAV